MGDKHMKKMLRKLNNESGSITVLVLASFIIILIVLLNLYISGNSKVSSQTKEINKIQKEYETSEDEMEEAYRKAIE